MQLAWQTSACCVGMQRAFGGDAMPSSATRVVKLHEAPARLFRSAGRPSVAESVSTCSAGHVHNLSRRLHKALVPRRSQNTAGAPHALSIKRTVSVTGTEPAPQPIRRPRVVDLMHLFQYEVPDRFIPQPSVGADVELGMIMVEENGETVLKELPVVKEGATPDRGDSGTGAGTGARLERMVLLDGANIAWGYGTALNRRFKCNVRPLSQGLLMALDYAPWQEQGFEVKAVMPFSYVQGELKGLTDGGSTHALLADKVVQLERGKDLWRNKVLWEEYEKGRLLLVKRPNTPEGRKLDDQTIIKTSHELGAYVCSNDQYRDHRKDKKLGFRNQKRIKAWATERKFGFKFHIATGLADGLLEAMWAATGFKPRVGMKALREAGQVETLDTDSSDEDKHVQDTKGPPAYHAMPLDVLPAVFEPVPNSVMLTMLLACCPRKE